MVRGLTVGTDGSGRSTAEITIVRGWLAAAKDQDVERLLALSLPGLEILGAAVQGADPLALRQWMSDTHTRFTRERFFQREESVVLCQSELDAAARDAGADEDGPATVSDSGHAALRFRVRELRVMEVEGYGDLSSALAAAGLTIADERSAAG